MRRDLIPGPDQSLVQLLTLETDAEVSEFQKTFNKNLKPGELHQARWVSDRTIALGTFPNPHAAAAATSEAAASPSLSQGNGGGGAGGAGGADELEGKTVAELKMICGTRSIAYTSSSTKAELLKALRGGT